MRRQQEPIRPQNEINFACLKVPKDSVSDDVLCPAEDEGGEGEPEAKRQRGEEGGEQTNEGSSALEEEARTVKSPPIPDTPSLEEVRQHNLTHNPYRSWCRALIVFGAKAAMIGI